MLKRNEIRVLTLLPTIQHGLQSPGNAVHLAPGIVRCTLERVSLDDYTRQYRVYKPRYSTSASELMLGWKAHYNNSPESSWRTRLEDRVFSPIKTQQDDGKSIMPVLSGQTMIVSLIRRETDPSLKALLSTVT